jgi:hypothetical protein
MLGWECGCREMQNAETWRVLQKLRLMIKVQICLAFKSTECSRSCPPRQSIAGRGRAYACRPAMKRGFGLAVVLRPWHFPAAFLQVSAKFPFVNRTPAGLMQVTLSLLVLPFSLSLGTQRVQPTSLVCSGSRETYLYMPPDNNWSLSKICPDRLRYHPHTRRSFWFPGDQLSRRNSLVEDTTKSLCDDALALQNYHLLHVRASGS